MLPVLGSKTEYFRKEIPEVLRVLASYHIRYLVQGTSCTSSTRSISGPVRSYDTVVDTTYNFKYFGNRHCGYCPYSQFVVFLIADAATSGNISALGTLILVLRALAVPSPLKLSQYAGSMKHSGSIGAQLRHLSLQFSAENIHYSKAPRSGELESIAFGAETLEVLRVRAVYQASTPPILLVPAVFRVSVLRIMPVTQVFRGSVRVGTAGTRSIVGGHCQY